MKIKYVDKKAINRDLGEEIKKEYEASTNKNDL